MGSWLFNSKAVRKRLWNLLHDQDSVFWWKRCLAWLEGQTHVMREDLFLAGLLLLAVYMVFGAYGGLICNLIAFTHPAIESVKQGRFYDEAIDIPWLTYWVVYGFFTVIEFGANSIVAWFPIYWVVKAVIMVILFTGGSDYLYDELLLPLIVKYGWFGMISDHEWKSAVVQYVWPIMERNGLTGEPWANDPAAITEQWQLSRHNLAVEKEQLEKCGGGKKSEAERAALMEAQIWQAFQINYYFGSYCLMMPDSYEKARIGHSAEDLAYFKKDLIAKVSGPLLSIDNQPMSNRQKYPYPTKRTSESVEAEHAAVEAEIKRYNEEQGRLVKADEEEGAKNPKPDDYAKNENESENQDEFDDYGPPGPMEQQLTAMSELLRNSGWTYGMPKMNTWNTSDSED